MSYEKPTKTTRGELGKKTFTTFCYEKNGVFWIEAKHVNIHKKVCVKYNQRLCELSNHKKAIRHLITKHNIDVITKKLRGFPVLSKDTDFLFFEDDKQDLKINLK